MSAENENRPAPARTRGGVVAVVSHELRGSLMTIVFATETLLKLTEGKLGSEEKKQLERIRRGAQEMRRLIDEVLDVPDPDAVPATRATGG